MITLKLGLFFIPILGIWFFDAREISTWRELSLCYGPGMDKQSHISVAVGFQKKIAELRDRFRILTSDWVGAWDLEAAEAITAEIDALHAEWRAHDDLWIEQIRNSPEFQMELAKFKAGG